MPLNNKETLIIMLVVTAATVFTRALPFILFPENKKTPKYIQYLGKVLPLTIVGMLVVYCLKDVSVLSGSHGIPELIAIVVIVILHLWKENTLLSIGVGTALYMFILQVFVR
jgi:branched-subunit amino acid transport protein AzlD